MFQASVGSQPAAIEVSLTDGRSNFLLDGVALPFGDDKARVAFWESLVNMLLAGNKPGISAQFVFNRDGRLECLRTSNVRCVRVNTQLILRTYEVEMPQNELVTGDSYLRPIVGLNLRKGKVYLAKNDQMKEGQAGIAWLFEGVDKVLRLAGMAADLAQGRLCYLDASPYYETKSLIKREVTYKAKPKTFTYKSI